MSFTQIFFLMTFFSLNAAASPEVLSFRGKVFWNDQPVSVKMKLVGKGALRTDEASAVVLKWDEHGSELRLAPESEAAWELNTLTPELIRGKILCHIRKPKMETAPTDDLKTSRFTLRTKAAVMGVRGTKFLGISTPLLAESEIIVFEGVVDFRSAQDTPDGRTITEGHWGGIGGRFGSKTTQPIKLPSTVLDGFLNSKDFKTIQ